MMKRFAVLCIFFLCAVGCKEYGIDKSVVTEISTEKSTYTIKVGESLKINLEHFPEESNVPEYGYDSSIEYTDVLQYDPCSMKSEPSDWMRTWCKNCTSFVGIKPGATKVGFRTIIGTQRPLYATCVVNVEPILAESISFIRSEHEVIIGSTVQLNYTILPKNTTLQDVEWQVEDTNILSIDSDGIVTTKNIGETSVRVKLKGTSLSDECKITVKPVAVLGVNISPQRDEAYVGEIVQLCAEVFPENATNKSLVWKSLNENIATVDNNGLVTMHSIGTATIQAITEDGGYIAEATIVAKEFNIEDVVTVKSSVGTEGSTNTYFYSYIWLHFNTNCDRSVNITKVILTDEYGQLKDSVSDIGECTTYKLKTITKFHSSSSLNTYRAVGWTYYITYRYENEEYMITYVNK